VVAGLGYERPAAMMKKVKYVLGSYIFKEGDLSQEAYRIIKGKVELTTDLDSKPVILAQLGKGDIFGEMAMIDERPRTASAQCLKPTECEVMDPGDFQSLILDQPARSLPYLSALFERLRSVTSRLQHEGRVAPQSQVSPLENEVPNKPTPIEAHPFSPFQMQAESQQETAASTIILKPMTPTCSSVMPEGYEAMQLVKFPFCIGRQTQSGSHHVEVLSANDFMIADMLPFQVSRNHCSIEREGDRYFVRDRGSTLGTIVNGVPLGAKKERLIYELLPGANELIVGSKQSPYVFQIDLA
jgi:hypothetical protein